LSTEDLGGVCYGNAYEPLHENINYGRESKYKYGGPSSATVHMHHGSRINSADEGTCKTLHHLLTLIYFKI